MSFMPEFELGLWNAWIFILFGPLLEAFVGFVINKEAMTKAHVTTAHSKTEKIIEGIYPILMIAFWVYSIFHCSTVNPSCFLQIPELIPEFFR